MSDLQDFIERALSDYMQERGGGMVSSWHFIADVVDSDGSQSWLYATAPDQLLMTTMGLIEWARGAAKYEQRRHLDDVGE